MGMLDGFRGMLADHVPDFLPEDPDKRAAAKQGLLAAGAAMMAAKGHNFFGSVGQGLLAGGETYQGALAQQQQDRLRKAQQQRWDMENQQNTDALARKKEEDAIIASFGDPDSISGAAGVQPTPNGAQPPAGRQSGGPGAGGAPAGGYSTAYNGTPYSGPEGAEAFRALERAGATNFSPEQGNQVMALTRQGMTVDQAAQMVLGGGGTAPARLGPAPMGPPPELPRIGQPRRPPAVDSSLEGAPGAGGTMPSAFTPGEPPRRLPSLGELPMIEGAQPPRRAAASLEGVPMKGQPRPASFARDAYSRNMAIGEGLRKKGHVDRANEYFAKADKLRPEIKDTVPMRTTDGRNVMVNRFKDGSVEEVEGYVPNAPELTWRDLGHETVGLDAEGKVVVRHKHGVSPGTQSYRGGFSASGGGGGRGAGSMKPMPAPALKMQQSELEALSTAQSIEADLANVEKQITDKTLVFSPTSNLWNQGLNAVGMSTEESRNFSSFRAQMEKLRNDSLRLNAGVQTDGDAQRAWNELFANINDTELVKQRLAEIRKINARAAQLRRLNVDSIRSNYGHNGYDFSAYDKATAPPPNAAGAPKPGTVDGGFRFKGGDPTVKANWEKVR